MIGVQHHAALLRVEGREQHILFKNRFFLFFFGHGKDAVHQRRLAGVRVADQRDNRNLALFAARPLYASRIFELCQLCLDVVHAPLDMSAVCFELLFARSSRTDTAAQS